LLGFINHNDEKRPRYLFRQAKEVSERRGERKEKPIALHKETYRHRVNE
jgi:hypothetical protein